MRQTILQVLLLGLPLSAQDGKGESPSSTIGPVASSLTSGIQEAIDALGSEGGVLTLQSGDYLLHRAIVVRSNVTLQGAGAKTVLRRGKQAEAKLASKAAPDEVSVRVEDASGFREGDEVGLFDAGSVGWLNAHVFISRIQGKELRLEGRIPKGYTFDPAKGGGMVNYFSAITGWDVSNVVIRNLSIDGRKEENPGPTPLTVRNKDLAFTFSAIHFVGAKTSRIESCQVSGWPSDGISLQGGNGNSVRKCVVENCRGEGLHPGGNLHDSEFSENESRGNGEDGLYFCAGNERILVRNNKFIGNKGSGVGGLGDWGDKFNIVENNHCEANGHSGITLYDGDSNTIRNNTCINNSQSSPGMYSGILLSKTAKSTICGNRCFDNQKTKTQAYGIGETANCQGNVITGNDCRGNLKSGLTLDGQGGERTGNRE